MVHGFTPINTPTDLLGNDSDPDGIPLTLIVFIRTAAR